MYAEYYLVYDEDTKDMQTMKSLHRYQGKLFGT